MPARNAAPTVEAALRSVLAAPEVGEVLLVDDGSTDGTGRRAAGIGDGRVTILPGPQAGVAAALNTGIAAATRPFLARCDADDLYPPDRLAWQCAWLEDHSDFAAVSAGFATVTEAGEHVADLACNLPAGEVTDRLRNGEVVTHLCTWLVRRETIARIGGARPWFVTAEDVDLQFRLAGAGRVWHVPRVAYLYRLHDSSITHSTSDARLAFFDAAAARFAHQRRDRGSDDLEEGAPPPLPAFDTIGNGAGHTGARAHIAGHLTAQAWTCFRDGRDGEAVEKLSRALRQSPGSWKVWRNYMALRLKILHRRWRTG